MEGEGELKAPRRTHLEALARQQDPDAIHELQNLPALPEHGAHLWAWFTDLHSTRSSSGMGPARLSRLEIHAWEQDEGITLEPWERRTIMQIDSAWVQAIHEETKGGETK